MAHRHISSNVNDLVLPDGSLTEHRFRREVAHGYIVSDVYDLIRRDPDSMEKGGRPRLSRQNRHGLEPGRVLVRHDLCGWEQ